MLEPHVLKHLALTSLMLTLLMACGTEKDGATFAGTAGRRTGDVEAEEPRKKEKPEPAPVQEPAPEPAPPEELPLAPDPYESLSWLWQCETTSTPPTTPASPLLALVQDADPNVVVLKGGGTHELDKDKIAGTPVIFSGTLCPPADQPRDIVLVIDTSGSMTDNDPLVVDTCGRLKAVQAVIASLPKGPSRMGLVTFGSDLVATSGQLFETQDQLFAAIAPGGVIADVLCEADGTTNYDAGLSQASALLSAGRADATKEIYFVSDGAPNADATGVELAATLKNPGLLVGAKTIPVLIGTVMLAGTDTVLEQLIASKDPVTGKPLHVFAAQTDLLAKALEDLSKNEIAAAELKYRVSETADYTSLDLRQYLNGLDFTLPPITLSADEAVSSVEVVLEYTDKKGSKSTSTGTLVLVSDAP
jgi:hypothetical protein